MSYVLPPATSPAHLRSSCPSRKATCLRLAPPVTKDAPVWLSCFLPRLGVPRAHLQASQDAQVHKVQVKICGLTRPEDAAVASQAGAAFVGMILWPKAGRYVGPTAARAIADAARAGGARPVGVFVDEGAEQIVRVCRELGLDMAQLHGDGARAAFQSLPAWLSTVYVLHVDPSGSIVTPLPIPGEGETGAKVPDWLLFDGLQGGSGATIDWEKLRVPTGCCKQGWMLAGGLTPGNVGAAVATLSPDAVDVSSGVCGPDKLAKDHQKIRDFVRGARSTEWLKTVQESRVV